MSGVFKFYDTTGVPLTVVFDYLKDKNIKPCWVSFIEEAKKSGWQNKTILSRLEESIIDTYGKEYWEKIRSKLDL